MYARPLLVPVDATATNALCCHVSIDRKTLTTPLCGVPWCEMFERCSVTVGPVTVSGS